MKEYTLLKDRQELIVKWKEPLLFVKLTICSDNVFGNILLLPYTHAHFHKHTFKYTNILQQCNLGPYIDKPT